MSGEILFLAHRSPFPPDRGDKIRSHHILKALARLAPVHVGAFADDQADLDSAAELALSATSLRVARRTKPLAIAALQGLVSGRPFSLPAFDDPGLHRWVREILATRPIATIYAFSSQMAQYVPGDFTGRFVMDFVDVDSAKFEAYAARAAQPMRTLYAREAERLARWEWVVARRANVSLLVSEEEAALFRSRLDLATRAAADVRALGNGIDGAFYSAAGIRSEPRLAGPGPHIVFTGQMDYPPNVAAVVRFASRIMPAIRARFPTAGFHVVGRRPTARVAALDGRHGVRVSGPVDDIRPWLAAADLVVAPLEIARGVQNKVLEALAMGRAVLASGEAAMGIAARDGIDIAIAEDDAAFIAKALRLLGDDVARAQLGEAARRFVVERLSWPAALAELPAIVGFEQGQARDAA